VIWVKDQSRDMRHIGTTGKSGCDGETVSSAEQMLASGRSGMRRKAQRVGWVEHFAKPIAFLGDNWWVSRSLSSGARSRDPLAHPFYALRHVGTMEKINAAAVFA
jgi:hypothetical protein